MPYVSKPMKLVTVWFTEEEKTFLDELAKTEDVTLSKALREILGAEQARYSAAPVRKTILSRTVMADIQLLAAVGIHHQNFRVVRIYLGVHDLEPIG